MQKEEFYKILKNNGILDRKSLYELQQLTEEYPFFQAAWVLYLKNLKESGHPDFEKELKKVAVRIPDRGKLFRFLYTKDGTHTNDFYFERTGIQPPASDQENSSQQLPGNNLIDKFLSRDPGSIKMDKQIFNEPKEENDIIEKSLAETDELITETLAMIYFEQKKYDKALDAFKKLSLKYPEKSSYFAARIEEIEKLKKFN